MFYQVHAEMKCQTQTVIVWGLSECVVPQDVINSPGIGKSNGKCQLQMFQGQSFIEYSNHDIGTVAVVSSGEPAFQMLTYEDLSSSTLQLVRTSGGVDQVFH